MTEAELEPEENKAPVPVRKRVVKKRKAKRRVVAKATNLAIAKGSLGKEKASLPENLNTSNRWGLLKRNKKQVACIIGGVLLLILGFWIATLWSGQRDNLLLTVAVTAMLPGGAYLIYRGLQKSDQEVVIVGTEKPTTKVNSLNIYATKDDDTGKVYPQKIAFEWVDNPKGQPQQCLNNSQWYYVHMADVLTGELKALILPDSQYFDPREFANVIKMPAHNKLFERKASMLQKVAPWVMVVAFIASLFGMLVTAPAP